VRGGRKLNNMYSEQDKDLNKLAHVVLEKYGIIPQNISIIQSGTIKTVWKVRANDRTLCLKRLKQTYDKALFSVNAQIYIKNKGGNVPEIILDKNVQCIVEYNNQLFVLYEWLEGKDLNFDNLNDLKLALEGLARFHTYSKGYESAENSRTSTKLGKWPDQYSSMKNKFISWKEISNNKRSDSSYNSYLKIVDMMVYIAYLAIDYIQKSSYDLLTSPGSQSIVLCHQDFGRGNAILTGSEVIVLDLDGVTFDLPARDLRKIIGKEAEVKGRWGLDYMENVYKIYTSINPMTPDEKRVLYIDLLYPHWFYGLIKNLFQNDKPIKAFEIERMAKLEESKVSLLKGLIEKG
jgi:spore coat protein I